MEAIAECIPNLEEITKLEIKEILKKDSEIVLPGRVKFKIKDDKELANFTYETRSSLKVYKFIEKLKFKDLESLENEIKKIKFPEIKGSFAVKCNRKGEHGFSSNEVEKLFGDVINKDNKIKVDLKNPITIVLVDIINHDCLVGIDFSGINLSKRPYRIKLIPQSINPCLAYCILRISEVEKKDIILDPFCKSGEIAIEAAFYLKNIPVNKLHLEKLAFTKLLDFNYKEKINKNKLNIYASDSLLYNLRSAEINAKIVNINKEIDFSRQDIDWIDHKFGKNAVDKIITFPIHATKTISKNKVDKLLQEFFFQAEFLLKEKGAITILTAAPKDLERHTAKYKFKKEKEYKINYMNQEFYIIVFKR
ncbi:MAG TPA: THUMP domain-containing protein [Candidatus Nanoarchaeia archaeon]|nr:THUMP domain-containing protein [Candidatus Nanoarchaeia archaeon]